MAGAPFQPMLAVAGALPAGQGWAYEFKWDGVRAIAVCSQGKARLYARRGNEITAAYPELEDLGRAAPEAVLDGEIVVLDSAGRPSFSALAERMHVRDRTRAARLAATLPVTYLMFDLLRIDHMELCELPYATRRLLLEELGLAGEHWAVPPAFSDAEATATASREHQLEGVIAKRLTAPYRPGLRTTDWVKVKWEQTSDFVVGGWRPGSRELGALLVGVPAPAGVGLSYRGRVGGGISDAVQRQLMETLGPLAIAESPFSEPLPREDARTAVWVRPEIVVELKYGERTADDRLRFPRFVRLRSDLTPDEVFDE